MDEQPTLENFSDPKIRTQIYYTCHKKFSLEEIKLILFYSEPIHNANLIWENLTQPQVFSERWNKSKILVIGTNYRPGERERWEQLDKNYIGLGFRFSGEELLFQDENPLEYDWDNVGTLEPLIKLIKRTNKKFDMIYMDIGVWPHLSDLMKFQLLHIFKIIAIPANVYSKAFEINPKIKIVEQIYLKWDTEKEWMYNVLQT